MNYVNYEDTVMKADDGLIPALPDDVAIQCLLRVPPHSHAKLQQVSRRWRELVNSPQFYEERKREGTSEKFVCMVQAMEPLPAEGKPLASPSSIKRSPVFGISVLNVRRRTWERLPPIPDFPESLPIFSRLVAVDGKLIVLGGWNPTTYETLQTLYIFNFVTQTWTRGSPMPTPRSFFACAAVENYVFVAGGHDNRKTALKSAEVYNLDTDQWAPVAPTNEERDEATGFSFDGKFYVVSGYATNSQGQFTESAEVYTPATNSWTLVDNMGIPSSRSPGPFAVMHGKLYAVNGQSLCSYNAVTSTWSVVESIPDSDVNPVCVAAIDDALLITGPSRNREELGFGTFLYKPAERNVTNRCKSEWESVERQAGFVGVAQSSHAIDI